MLLFARAPVASAEARPPPQRRADRRKLQPPAQRPAPALPVSEAGDAWRVFDVSVPLSLDAGKDSHAVTPAVLSALQRKLGVTSLRDAEVVIVRKSLDARTRRVKSSHSEEPSFSYVLDVDAAALSRAGAALVPTPGRLERAPPPPPPLVRPGGGAAVFARAERVYVVGGGPSGLFAALRLSDAGVPVTLLERGRPVEERGRDIGALFARRILTPDSNLCYGEGGAGTWSDGKLTTRIGRNSDAVRSVLTALVAFGAPDSILTDGASQLRARVTPVPFLTLSDSPRRQAAPGH